MLDWMQQFMDPANQDAIANALAQKSAVPPEVLAYAQNAPQGQQPSPMNPGQSGFAQVLQSQAQPMPAMPAPQSSFGPDFNAPAMQVPAQQPPVAQPQLTAEQMAALAPENLQDPLRSPGAPSPMGGHGVSAPQMLSVATPQQRLTLAQLLSGRR